MPVKRFEKRQIWDMEIKFILQMIFLRLQGERWIIQ